MDFIQQFRAAQRVSTPLICVRTFDAKSATDSIVDSLGDQKKATGLLVWDAIHGLFTLTDSEKSTETFTAVLSGKAQPITLDLPSMLKMAEAADISDAIIFVANAHLFWQSNGNTDPIITQAIWNLRDVYKASGNMLVLLAAPGSKLPGELQNDVLTLDEPLPTAEKLQAIIKETYTFAKRDGSDEAFTPTDTTLKQATDALIGLPTFPSEQSTAMCLTVEGNGKKRTGTLNISDLWERKRQIVNSAPGLRVFSGKERLEDIGGVEAAKEFFRAIMESKTAPKVILFMDEIEKAFAGTGTDLSGTKTEMTGGMLSWMQDKQIRGTISIGIPGVSKSALAKALGGTYGVPVINFDLAAMQGGIIGQSMDQLLRAQSVVDAISGGSVLAIATCNGIESLPPELRRRFSLAQFFFDAPSAEERKLIWEIHRKRYNIPATDEVPDDTGWTGAEIESCCDKAHMLGWSLQRAGQYIVPVTVSAKERIDKTRQDASGKYLSASKAGIYYSSESISVPSKSSAIQPPVFSQKPNDRRMRD